jgi:hypothetical protein
MNGLLTHSNLSLESFESASQRPPSIVSFVTDTSTDTVQARGIGTLSGRMVYAVGEVALRGIENLAIRRRLGKVISAFPHQDDIVTSDIDTIYDHTLEFSRYSVEFRVYPVNLNDMQVRSLCRSDPAASIASAAYSDCDTSNSASAEKSGEMASF